MTINGYNRAKENGFYYATKNGVKVASWEPLINTYNAKEYQNET